MLKDYKSDDIFNYNETGIFYAMPPDRGLAKEQQQGTKSNKVCWNEVSKRLKLISYLSRCDCRFYSVATCRDGKVTAFIDRKGMEASSVSKKDGEGTWVRLSRQPKSLDDHRPFQFNSWLEEWDKRLVKENRHRRSTNIRKVILFTDKRAVVT